MRGEEKHREWWLAFQARSVASFRDKHRAPKTHFLWAQTFSLNWACFFVCVKCGFVPKVQNFAKFSRLWHVYSKVLISSLYSKSLLWHDLCFLSVVCKISHEGRGLMKTNKVQSLLVRTLHKQWNQLLQQAWETLQSDCELFHDPVKVLQPSHNLLSCIFFLKVQNCCCPLPIGSMEVMFMKLKQWLLEFSWQ